MKKNALVFICLIASFISCNKDEFKDSLTVSPSTKRIAAAPIQTTVTPLTLSKDADFKSLDLIITDIFGRKKNLILAKQLIDKKILTAKEKEQLAIAMGYKSSKEADQIKTSIGQKLYLLNKKYKVLNLSQTDQINLFDNSSQLLIGTQTSISSNTSRSCLDHYKSQIKLYKGIYIGAMAGCVGLGWSFGVATWYAAGAGAIVGVACEYGALMAVEAGYDLALDDYNACLKN